MTSAHRDLVLAALSQDPAVIHTRMELLARHNITGDADEQLDAIANRLAEETGFPYAMVNFTLSRQRFAGLHNPPPDSGLPIVGRDMDPRHGWCPHVVNRKLALPLHDVHASRTYSGNPVVDAIGITSYYGEPLIYPDTDIVLGTACVIDQQVHNIEESDALMQSVERAAAEAMANILAR